jgi:hypothetical protein
MDAGRALERRYASRVRVELFLNQYIRDRWFRVLAMDLSPTGLRVQKLLERHIPLSRIVGLELELPGTNEVIWASAEPRFDALDEDFQVSGLTFVHMAHKHERLLHEFLRRKQARSWSWPRRAPARRRAAPPLPGRSL